jgi:NMD protein affecting ribosome stability and mRNA decay
MIKRSKPQMGICRRCGSVRVLVAGLCRDCRDADSAPAPTSTTPPTEPRSS